MLIFFKVVIFLTDKKEASFKEVKELVLSLVKVKRRLLELGIGKNDTITNGYAQWFCSKKYNLKLNKKENQGYYENPIFNERIKIVSKIGSDTNFESIFDGIFIEKFDYLFVVFINEKTWMIDSIYKVPCNVVKDFLSLDQKNSFQWKRETRSLSLQIYPDEEHMILL